MDPYYGNSFIADFIGSPTGGATVIFIIIVSLVQCFFGYKLFRYLVTVVGFVFFSALGYNIGVPIAGAQSPFTIVIALVLGVAGGFIAFKFYKAGVFIQCFIAGALVGWILAFLLGWLRIQTFALAIVIGIAVGILGIKLIKPIIIACSALAGGIQAGVTLAMLVRISNVYGLLLGAALAVAGLFYQINPVLPKFNFGKNKKSLDEKLKETSDVAVPVYSTKAGTAEVKDKAADKADVKVDKTEDKRIDDKEISKVGKDEVGALPCEEELPKDIPTEETTISEETVDKSPTLETTSDVKDDVTVPKTEGHTKKPSDSGIFDGLKSMFPFK